jgi:hypothetical protein
LSAIHARGAEPAAPANTSAARGDVAAPLDAVIEIERAPGSEVCPDAESVFRAVARLFPERAFRESTNPAEAAASARVVIRPTSPGYEAVVTVERPRRGERVILDKDENCRGLADALALAFVLLVEPPDSKTATDAGAIAATPAVAAAAAPAPSSTAATQETQPKTSATPPRAQEASAPARTSEHSFRVELGASAAGGVGLLHQPALGIAAGIELTHTSGFEGSVEVLRLWSAPVHAQGGSVTLTLWSALFGPGYRFPLNKSSSLNTWLLLGAGAQHAETKDFIKPKSGSFSWLVLMPALGYRLHASELVSGFARVGPVFQLLPQSFSVEQADGSGTTNVASAPKVGVMAELGVAFGGKIF